MGTSHGPVPLSFAGDVIVAQQGGPHAAGNVYKAPSVLHTPQEKVQRTTSELSMLAAPTLMDGSMGTPRYDSQDGGLPRIPSHHLLQDAQSQPWTEYTPSVAPPKAEDIPPGQPTPKHGEKTPKVNKPEHPKKPNPSTSSGAKYDKYYHQKLVQISYFFLMCFGFQYCNLLFIRIKLGRLKSGFVIVLILSLVLQLMSPRQKST